MKTTKTLLVLLSLAGLFLPFITKAAEFSCNKYAHNYIEDYYIWACEVLPEPLPNNCDNDSYYVFGTATYCRGLPIGYACEGTASKISCAGPSTNQEPRPQPNQQTNPACPDQKPGELCYTPLEPFPGVDQSGSRQSLESLLNFIFKTLFTIGGLIAVLFLILGGLAYMTSEVAHKKEEAKKRIAGAVYGLVLLAVSWIILNEINPELLNFDLTSRQTQSPNTPAYLAPTPATNSTVFTCYEYDDSGRSRPTRSITISNDEISGETFRAFNATCPGTVKITRTT